MQLKFFVLKVIILHFFTSLISWLRIIYFNINRTYQDFRSWISRADSRRWNCARTCWDCWLHGYVKHPLLVTFYQKICFCEYKNCIGPGLVTRHIMGRRKVIICICRCYSIISLLITWKLNWKFQSALRKHLIFFWDSKRFMVNREITVTVHFFSCFGKFYSQFFSSFSKEYWF